MPAKTQLKKTSNQPPKPSKPREEEEEDEDDEEVQEDEEDDYLPWKEGGQLCTLLLLGNRFAQEPTARWYRSRKSVMSSPAFGVMALNAFSASWPVRREVLNLSTRALLISA